VLQLLQLSLSYLLLLMIPPAVLHSRSPEVCWRYIAATPQLDSPMIGGEIRSPANTAAVDTTVAAAAAGVHAVDIATR
jgi:hypothetical protein